MLKPRLIACDVDGTLLPEGHTKLDPTTIALIERLLDAGIVFAPASGRQYANLTKVFEPFSGRIPLIAENGTYVFMNDEVIFRAQMDKTLGDDLVRTVLGRNPCEALVTGERISYLQPKDPAFVRLMCEEKHYVCTVVEDLTNLPEPYTKVSVFHPHAADDAPFWRQRFGQRCTVALSGATWIDLMPSGISKASGVKALCNRLGIAPADCLAIGDNENDVEMFDFVGYAIAMDSASEEARLHARETTPSPNEVFRRILALL